MKRRGSALVSVLIASSLLLGIGTIVSATVVNTTKLNQRYSENIDLDLAAKSALNYGIDYLTNNYRTINETGFKSEGILDDEQTNITKSIEISKSGEEFTVIGRAKLNGNSEISAEESTIIKISNNDNNDNSSNNGNYEPTEPTEPSETPADGNEIETVNFINAIKDVSLGYTNLNYLKYIACGGNLTSNDWAFNQPGYNKPAPSDELKNKEISFNSANFNSLLDEYERDKYTSFEMTESYSEIKGQDVKANTFQNLNNNNIIVDGKVYLNSGDTTWKVDGKILIINGDLDSNTKVDIEVVNEGKVIINGNININNKFNITVDKNSLIEVNGKVKVASTTNIEMDNSTIFINNDFESTEELNFNINNSKVDARGKIITPAVISVNMNSNSRFDIGNDFESGTRFNLNVHDSIINIYGSIKASAEININIKDGKFIVRGGLSKSGAKYDFILDNSLLIASDLTAPGGCNIISNKSVIVADYIKSSSVMNIDLVESNLIIKDSFDVSGVIAKLDNSTMISIKLFRTLWNSTITNNGKSYVLSGGNFETNGVSIDGEGQSIIPDSNIVIDSIKYFIEVN